jgi:DNA-binding transcriptional LysR family regulator
MNLATLATFLAVLDKGTFAAASVEVGCTPSAVSLQMKQLEAFFGKPLFDRSGRVIKPTEFALEVSRVARHATSELELLRVRPLYSVGGVLKVGAIASVQTDLLPYVLRLLRDRHPGLDVTIAAPVDSDLLLDELMAGNLDAAVVVRPSTGGTTRAIWDDILQQPFALLASEDSQGDTAQELFSRYDWIGYDRQLTGGRLAAEYVRHVAPASRSVMEFRSIDAIVAMVSQGLGVSVVPLPRSPLLSAYKVRAIPLDNAVPSRHVSLVRRKSDEGSRNIAALRDALLDVAAHRRPV